VTNTAIPPGDWTVGIKAVDTSGNESANATTANIIVSNSNDVIVSSVEAPRWPGTRSGLVKHDVSGRLIPESNTLASAMTDAQLWDQMVYDPVTDPYYEAKEIDLGFDADDLRVWSDLNGAVGPGESGVVALDMQIDYRDEADSYDGFGTWKIGSVDFRRLKARAFVLTSVSTAYLSVFTPTIDVPEHEDRQTGIVIAPGGSTVTFGRTFHGAPNVQITAQDSGGSPNEPRIATYSWPTSTDVFVVVWDQSGVDVGGTVNLTAIGP